MTRLACLRKEEGSDLTLRPSGTSSGGLVGVVDQSASFMGWRGGTEDLRLGPWWGGEEDMRAVSGPTWSWAGFLGQGRGRSRERGHSFRPGHLGRQGAQASRTGEQ